MEEEKQGTEITEIEEKPEVDVEKVGQDTLSDRVKLSRKGCFKFATPNDCRVCFQRLSPSCHSSRTENKFKESVSYSSHKYFSA